jgi:hypothetical protein
MVDDSTTTLSGHLNVYPFGHAVRSELVANKYRTLLEQNENSEILCLTRLCSETDLTESLSTSLDTVGHPAVETLTNFAVQTLEVLEPQIEQLSDHERIELLAEHLSTHEWETDYLATAAQQSSFGQDIGRLLIEMESRDCLSPEAYNSPILREIAAVGRQFRALLEEKELIDRPSLVPRATEAVQTTIKNNSVPDVISQREVLLIADFEEFASVERQFLHTIAEAADATICAIAERQSRILSSWREAGSVEEMASGLTVTSGVNPTGADTAPQAVGEYLITGGHARSSHSDGTVQVIEADTFEQQLTQIADEIEHLCRSAGYEYSDITVCYQDSSAPVDRTIRQLQRHGIPTTAVTVSRLGEDPAVRELHDVAVVGAETSDEDDVEGARERLLAIDGVTEPVIRDIATASTATAGLWSWVGETQLKHRIGTQWEEIAARDQFRRLREVIELAEFLETTPELEDSWERFLIALERAFKYSSTRVETIETDQSDGGVAVKTIYGLKHSSSKAVFLPNVTDDAYPFTPDLTPLLPMSRLRKEPTFPTLTAPSQSEIKETFRPTVDSSGDGFTQYFTEVSRRLLGTAASGATERLYFALPQEGADSLGTYHQPSRFLTDLIEEFSEITPLTHDGKRGTASHGGASEFVVEHVDQTLEAVRRAAVGGDSVDLESYECELSAIETLLEQPEATTVRDAIEARIDFRHGRVRRE